MDVRARHDDDLEELVTIAPSVYAADGYPIFLPDRDFARFLTTLKPVAAWVAVRDERIVGHVALNAQTSRPVMALVAKLAPRAGTPKATRASQLSWPPEKGTSRAQGNERGAERDSSRRF